MWLSGTPEMQHTYGKDYLNSLLEGQAAGLQTSAKSTGKVIDALIDSLSRSWPKSRYIVGGWWLDRSAVGLYLSLNPTS